VAVAAGAWKLVDTLLHQPAYAALSPRDKARAIWPYALASASRTAGLFGRRVALPSFGNDPELAGALLQHALCSGQAALAGAFLAGDEGRLAAGSFGPSAAGCPRIEGSVSPDKLPARHWQDIEQRLGQPVLPWLAIQATTPARAAGLLAAGLRSPWGEPAALGLYLRHALRAPAGIPLLRAVPPGALRSALHDDAILAEWLAASVDWPQADLDWALAQVAPARLAGQLESCSSAGDIPASPAGTPGIAPVVWPAGRPSPTASPRPAAGRRRCLPVRGAAELWPRWFALGYRPADRQWADWLTGLEPANLERVWPLIARTSPRSPGGADMAGGAPVGGPIDDPEARRLSYRGLYHHDPDFLAKARLLAAHAGRVGQPRWLAAEFALENPRPASRWPSPRAGSSRRLRHCAARWSRLRWPAAPAWPRAAPGAGRVRAAEGRGGR
jgi:hypothetical protein